MNIGFLFGAGAEADGNFGFPSGIEFMRKSYLSDDHKNKVTGYLGDWFVSSYYGSTYNYTKTTFVEERVTTGILKLWIMNYNRKNDMFSKYKKDIKNILNNEEYKDFVDDLYYDGEISAEEKDKILTEKTSDTSKDVSVQRIFRSIITSENEADWDECDQTILEIFLERDPESGEKFFNKDLPTGISHVLDKNFHTIIEPIKFGKNNFSRVFNYYWMIFYSLYFLLEDNKTELGYAVPKTVLEQIEFIRQEYKGDISDQIEYNDSYYSIINEKLKEREGRDSVSGVITSNYYKFAEIVSKNISYVHGKLSWFEFPETNQVLDVTETLDPFNKDVLFFPFIMGQSFLKPIVSSKQIREYQKMDDILDDTNILVILGYGINADDNHLNSYLREFVCSKNGDRRIIYVTSEEDISFVYKNLRMPKSNNIIHCKVEYPNKVNNRTNKNIIEDIFSEIDKLRDYYN